MLDFDKLTRNQRSGGGRRMVAFVTVAAMVVGLGAIAVAMSLMEGESRPGQAGVPGASGVLERLSSVSGEPQNILVLGLDDRPEVDSAVEGARADTIMLFRVYPDTGRVKVLSVPRDLLVEIEPGVQDKINASYAYGEVSGTISAVEQLTGLYVDHYGIVDFVGFEKIIDSLGGINLDPDESILPEQWNVDEGVQHFNGRRTLIYARSRSTEGGDLDRIRRQQEVLAALRSQAFSWRSVEKLPEITRTISENVETDMSFTETASLGQAVGRHGRGALMTSTQLKGTPVTLDNGSEVLVPDEESNAVIIREFLD